MLSAPPAGLRGNAAVLLILGIVVLVICGGMGAAGIAGLKKNPAIEGYIFVGTLLTVAVLAPAVMFAGAIQIARRRIQFIVGAEQLIVRYAGPLRRSERRIARNEVRGVTAEEAVSAVNGKAIQVLNIHLANSDLRLLQGMPREQVTGIAAGMSDALAAGATNVPQSPLLAAFPRPPSAKLELEDDGTTLTLLMPAKGWRSMGGAVAAGSLLFLLFVAGIPLVLLLASIVEPKPGDGLTTSQWVRLGIFLAGGLYMFSAGIKWVFERSAMVVTPEALVFTCTSPFRKRELVWNKEEITGMTVMEIKSDKAVYHQLEISSKGRDKPHVILAYRDFHELAWITNIVYHRMGRKA